MSAPPAHDPDALLALPGIGVAAELIPVTFKTRQVLRPVKFAGIALVGVAAFAARVRGGGQRAEHGDDGGGRPEYASESRRRAGHGRFLLRPAEQRAIHAQAAGQDFQLLNELG